MKPVWLIRHGATEGNLQRRYIGRTDQPLCPLGEEQALRLRGSIPAARLFASPLLRARQTAALALPGAAVRLEEDLRETDFGDFEGKTAREMAEDAAYRLWVEGGCTGPIPGGDLPEDCSRRCVAAFFRCMAAVPEGEGAAFVLHGGGIMAIMEALALPRRSYYEWHIGNGELYAGVFDGERILVSLPG